MENTCLPQCLPVCSPHPSPFPALLLPEGQDRIFLPVSLTWPGTSIWRGRLYYSAPPHCPLPRHGLMRRRTSATEKGLPYTCLPHGQCPMPSHLCLCPTCCEEEEPPHTHPTFYFPIYSPPAHTPLFPNACMPCAMPCLPVMPVPVCISRPHPHLPAPLPT